MLRKKILYVTAHYDGGIGRHLTSLLAHFTQDHAIIVASPRPAPFARGEKCNIAYHNLPLDKGGAYFGGGKAMVRLARLCQEVQPGLIHAHGFKAAMLSLPSAMLYHYPLIVTVHNFLAYPEKSFLPESLFNRALRLMDPLVSCYITVSDALRRYLTDCGLNPARIKTIYNGVPGVYNDPGFIPVRRPLLRTPLWEMKTLNETMHIGTVGRLVPQKGMDIFIQAAAQLADNYPRGHLRFYIAGDGPERDRLERLRDSLGLQDLLIFKGKVLNMDVFLNSLDIFVLASRSEGLSFSLLEAAAAQLPIVATACGGIPEIITHSKTGLLVPSENSMALNWALSRLVKQPQLRIKLGTAALEEVKRRFTEKKMLAQTASLYRDYLIPIEERGKGKVYSVK